MKADAVLAPVSWPRMIRAVEKVRERLLRAVKALEDANLPYAIIGGNAVAAWVSRVDEAAAGASSTVATPAGHTRRLTRAETRQ